MPDPTPGPDADDPGDRPEALSHLLDVTDAFVNRSAGRLPTGVVVDVRALTDVIRATVATTAVRPLDVHAVMSVRGILEDYLPTTLKGYLAVDPALVDVARGAAPSPGAALVEQVGFLSGSAEATLEAVRVQDVDALTTQGRFLQTKFTRSDLTL